MFKKEKEKLSHKLSDDNHVYIYISFSIGNELYKESSQTKRTKSTFAAYTFSDRVICQRYDGNPLSFWMQKSGRTYVFFAWSVQFSKYRHPPPQVPSACMLLSLQTTLPWCPTALTLTEVRNHTLSEGASIFDTLKQKSPSSAVSL